MILEKLDHLQGTRVLPVARAIVVVAALLCLLVICGAAAWIIILQLRVWAPPSQETVPPLPQRPTVENVDLDAEAVTRHLNPPTGVAATPLQSLTKSLEAGDAVSVVRADTVNGLASLPEGLLVLSSPDGKYFRPAMTNDGKLGLAATPSLVDLAKIELQTADGPRTRAFHLRLAVRDRYGMASTPADVELRLVFDPHLQQSSDARAPETDVADLTHWQLLARDIALVIDPSRSPAYFDAYSLALEVPQQCKIGNRLEAFAAEARRAFELSRERLAIVNQQAFYDGLCSAWKSARQAENAEWARIDAAQRAAANARQQIVARNNSALANAAAEAFRAQSQQRASLAVIGSMLVAFLFVSLVIAFLAIESHSKAIRTVMETMAGKDTSERPEPK